MQTVLDVLGAILSALSGGFIQRELSAVGGSSTQHDAEVRITFLSNVAVAWLLTGFGRCHSRTAVAPPSSTRCWLICVFGVAILAEGLAIDFGVGKQARSSMAFLPLLASHCSSHRRFNGGRLQVVCMPYRIWSLGGNGISKVISISPRLLSRLALQVRYISRSCLSIKQSLPLACALSSLLGVCRLGHQCFSQSTSVFQLCYCGDSRTDR